MARFAIPAGVVIGTGLIAGYLFALHDLDLSVTDSRTVALTTLVATGLYLVMVLEAGGSLRRSALVAGMCAVMAALYVLVLVLPATRSFFELTAPGAGMVATARSRRCIDRGARAVRILAAHGSFAARPVARSATGVRLGLHA